MTAKSHERDDASNHRQPDCLFNNFSSVTAEKTSKLCITGPLWMESTGDRWIPSTKGLQCGTRFCALTSSYPHVRSGGLHAVSFPITMAFDRYLGCQSGSSSRLWKWYQYLKCQSRSFECLRDLMSWCFHFIWFMMSTITPVVSLMLSPPRWHIKRALPTLLRICVSNLGNHC